MSTNRREDDDERERRRIAADGERVRVSMTLMDAARMGERLPPSGHRPGQAQTLSDAERDARSERIAQANARLRDAWRSCPTQLPSAALGHEPAASERRVDDRSPAQRKYEERIANAWRNPL